MYLSVNKELKFYSAAPTYDNGVLTIKMAKKEEARTKVIKVHKK